MMNDEFKEHEQLIAAAPSESGVYLMKDADGRIIYIGKAQHLKKRLSSYFRPPDQLDLKTQLLVKKISEVKTIITKTEKEAFILEANLIRQHRPRYNVMLKDDKRYPSLRIDPREAFPALAVVRKTQNDGALYFGPFSSTTAMRNVLKIIHKTFKLRKCKNLRQRLRPCLNYQIGVCQAPCCMKVDSDTYHAMVREVILFLRGRTPDLIAKIKSEMLEAAQLQKFEEAAQLRDKLFALQKTLEKQVTVTTDFMDRDVVALAANSEHTVITVMSVRNGFLQGVRHFDFWEILSADTDMISLFLRQYYQKMLFIPKEVLVSVEMDDKDALTEWLSQIRGSKVSLICPQRGEKVRIMAMAIQNAQNRLREVIASRQNEAVLMERLKKRLNMDRAPQRIECFDNSNISGKSAVSARVVFQNGKPEKSSYRKYKIKTVTEPDDYASMKEVLQRRFDKSDPHPDLLMVDGGRGQLNIAVNVMRELNLDGAFSIIGIAKKDEKKGDLTDKIYVPGRANPINFGKENDLLLFLQHVRDEAHRFAISFHRKKRDADSLISQLDTISGIGKKRKLLLINHFGSIEAIRAASIEELQAIPGIPEHLAHRLKDAFMN